MRQELNGGWEFAEPNSHSALRVKVALGLDRTHSAVGPILRIRSLLCAGIAMGVIVTAIDVGSSLVRDNAQTAELVRDNAQLFAAIGDKYAVLLLDTLFGAIDLTIGFLPLLPVALLVKQLLWGKTGLDIGY